MSQIANSYLLVRPSYVSFNNDTSESNFFRDENFKMSNSVLLKNVLSEFELLVKTLKNLNVDVFVVDADNSRKTTSALFCSDWISTHADGNVVVYPLLSKDRQLDRNENVLESIEESGFVISDIIDFTDAEMEKVYLESSSSMVLDRANKIAYASISSHTDEELFIEFCEDLEFTPIVFSSFDKFHRAVCYTNFLLSIGEHFALFASGMIKEKKERKLVSNQLKSAGKEIIFISEEQVFQFLGNAIQIKNKKGELFLLMSGRAKASLTNDQLSKLEKHNKIVSIKIDTIEKLLGGSVRNMMLELFLEKK
jgi:hypothetical protein